MGRGEGKGDEEGRGEEKGRGKGMDVGGNSKVVRARGGKTNTVSGYCNICLRGERKRDKRMKRERKMWRGMRGGGGGGDTGPCKQPACYTVIVCVHPPSPHTHAPSPLPPFQTHITIPLPSKPRVERPRRLSCRREQWQCGRSCSDGWR